MSVVFWFFLLISPFVLWRLAMIGPSFVSTGSRTHFLVTEPPPHTWISLSHLLEAVVMEHSTTIRKTIARELPNHDITLDFPAVQGEIVRMGLVSLVRAVKHSGARRIGIDIDYEHQASSVLKLTSDEKTSNYLGLPKPIKFAIGSTEPTLDWQDDLTLYIRMTRWCRTGYVFINGLRIKQLTIEDGFASDIGISNCLIDHISILTNSVKSKPTLRISSTRIRCLSVRPLCCSDILLANCSIREISCPPPDAGNPFGGSLVLSGDIKLGERYMREESIQHYRNLRHNLADRRNSWAVYVVRAVELAAERTYDTNALTKIVNYVYEFSSGYGNIPERALAMMIALIVYNVLLISLNELYVVGLDCATVNLSAWVATLCRGDWSSTLLASLLLALQGVLNPFAMFGADRAVTPSSVLLTVWLWLSNVAMVALLTLVAVGVRRRMKD